jgi:Holliday junction resolvasome RuvABC endonuclease subunit
MKTILALDLAGITGWALYGDFLYRPNNIISGTWDIKPSKNQQLGHRYIKLRQQLDKQRLSTAKIDVIGCEQAHHRGRAATEYAIGCLTTVQAFCAEFDIKYLTVHSGTIKKSVTGNGSANKEQVICKLWQMGFNPKDDNEADAIALCLKLVSD